MGIDVFDVDMRRYPSEEEGLSALLNRPAGCTASWKGPYIPSSNCLVDPWGNYYVYSLSGLSKGQGYRVFSMGPNGEKDTNGIVDDIYFKPALKATSRNYKQEMMDLLVPITALLLFLVVYVFALRKASRC